MFCEADPVSSFGEAHRELMSFTAQWQAFVVRNLFSTVVDIQSVPGIVIVEPVATGPAP